MKNLEDLKGTWQAQRGISQQRFDQISAKVRGSSDLLQTTIFRRDMRETAASVLVLVFFLPGLFAAKNWVAWSGFAIEVVAGLTIPLVLWWARKRLPASFSAANFLDFVHVEIDFLRRQIRLLKWITWWYLLPIYVGIVLITVGIKRPRFSTADVIFAVVYLLSCAGLFVFIWWLNQRARRTCFEPLLEHYLQMQAAIESGDDFVSPLPDPLIAFLQPKPRKPMTRRRRWIWGVSTAFVTALVAGLGYAISQSFDARTGFFITSTAPLVALLMIVVSGVWRRNSDGVSD